MNFMLKTTIASSESLAAFYKDWGVGQNDLIVTNEFLLKDEPAPCDCLYQERYGSGEPTDEMVDAMLLDIKGKNYNRIIAIGGGTVIDIAKLFVFEDGCNCEEIFAKGASLERKRSFIAIPTTCGTGSEVTCISIVGFEKKGTKLGLAIPALFPDEAVLIPSLLDTLPYDVFATSSIDALIHAVESYVSPRSNDFVRAMGRSAIEMILRGYKQMESGKLPKDMLPFLSASTMAGIAFGNAGCAAVHALAYPLGAIYHVPHGKANYLVFGEVFRAYMRKGADLSVLENVFKDALGAPEDIWGELFSLLDKVLIRQPLSELGVDSQKCAEMAESVDKNQQRLLKNNPIELSVDEIRQIYLNCM